jgi:hypothetical protein
VVSTGGADRVAGDRGTVLLRIGRELIREESSTEERLLTMFAATPSILYAGGENGRVIRRSNGAWERVDVGADGAKITGGWASGAEAIAFTTDGGALIEKDGEDWISTTSVETGTAALPLFGVWSSTAGADIYAVGLGGAIFRRASGAEELELEATPAPGDLYAIFGTGPDRIWAVGANGAIVEWDGVEWRGVPSGTSQDLFAIHGTRDGSYVVAAGDRGTMVILASE